MMDDTLTPHAHHILDVMTHILLFLGIAGIIVPLLERIRVSAMLGYLFCGVLIGPFGLAAFADYSPWLKAITFQDSTTVHTLGEFGIIALMFMIGLELSFKRLRELGKYIFGLGSAQILITAAAISGIALFFDNSLQAAILLGASFALSSTAIVMKLLEEKHYSNQFVGVISFSILLMQDLAVVPILVLAGSFTGGEDTNIATALLEALVLGVVAVLLIYTVGKRVLRPLLQSISLSRNAEWLTAFVIFIIIGCASLTYVAGLSLALGAFLAGLLIAETEYRHEVETIISPIKGILLGMFFLSIGMMINMNELMRYPLLIPLSVVGIFLFKAMILFPLCRAFGLPSHQSATVAIFLAEPGEFALMVLGIAMSSALMPATHVQFFLLVTAFGMLCSPLLFKIAPVVAKWLEKPTTEQDIVLSSDSPVVVIAGFGRVGVLLARALHEQNIPYLAFDSSAERVQKLKKEGFSVVYGDARKLALWKHLQRDNVLAVMIALDDSHATHSILGAIRGEWPLVPIIVRSKDTSDMHTLYELGANYVIAETLESSLRAARIVMEEVGEQPEEIETVVRALWDRYS
jgi:CPA2 family monovalent cation:H+ antiporter-2